MDFKYYPYCGGELEEHELEFKIDDCGLTKTWYQDSLYCRKCDEAFYE